MKQQVHAERTNNFLWVNRHCERGTWGGGGGVIGVGVGARGKLTRAQQ